MRSLLKAAALLALAGMAGSAVAPASAQETKVGVGMSGWTGFAPLTLANEAGIFKKNGLDVDHQEDPAEGPPPGDRVGRHPVRGHHGGDLDRLERQRRRRPSRSSSSTSPTAPTAWPCATTSPRSADLKGKTVAASRAGHRAVLHAGLDAQEERPSMKDVKVVNLEPQPAAQAFVAGQNDAAMTYEPYLSTVRANAGGRQDHRHHARLPHGDGHLRLHAQVPRRESQGGARRWPTAISRPWT